MTSFNSQSPISISYEPLNWMKLLFNHFWTKFESINELTHAHNVELCQFYSDLVQTFQILVKNHDSAKFYGVYHPERIESIILNAKQDLLIFDKLRFTLSWDHVTKSRAEYSIILILCDIIYVNFVIMIWYVIF